jgi:predicted helicase
MPADTAPKRNGPRPARVRHADLWGLRQAKYDWLDRHDVGTTDWEEIAPKSEFYLFVPRDEAALERYEQFVKVTDIFPVHSVGIVTSRDRFVVDFDRDALERRIRQFLDPNTPDDQVRRAFNLKDNRDWKMADKRRLIRQDEDWTKKIVRCLYRPFDVRWLFYHPAVIERDRWEVMRHMLGGSSMALMLPRQHRDDFGAFVTRTIGTHKTVAAYDINYYFPLYLTEAGGQNAVFARLDEEAAEPNVSAIPLAILGSAYGGEFGPTALFHYVYAVLYAPSYREKYAEFLKTDFPRIPFTADPELFEALAALGGRLVDLHLLRSDELDPPLARFHGEGDGRVAKTKSKGFRYEPDGERVWVNKTQHFAPVAPELWEYHVGGYRVLHKWLKDRRERRLSPDEVRTYCRIVTALARTIEVQEEIDALYPAAEGDVIPIPPAD